ncbi:MAG TPA: polyamine ABC transporter substrate-binding protein [Steroidobacteraceae bacterium]|nr:polyamine ABC transporter substrate-binding protein [Steroidobacteraceae bacterium]
MRAARAGAVVAALAVAALLGACGARAQGPRAAADAEKELRVYNWADYIGKDTVADFEAATGIKVIYDTYDADETLEAKMMAGDSGYDVVSTSTDFFSRQIKAGIYRPLDRSLLPNWKNLDPHVLAIEAQADPGNRHAMPYLKHVNGFAYNVDLIRARMPDAPVDSLDMIFKPEIIRRFADCGVTFLDQAEDVLQLALNYLHLDPNTTRVQDYRQAERLLLAVRPYIRAFDSSEYMNGLANGEFCISMSWSGDYATSRARATAAGVDVHLAFSAPKEGSNGSFDAWLIPADAPHPLAAHKFLNYILEPRVIAAITNHIHYANDNLAANAYVDPQILNDPAVYPTPAMEARLYRSSEAGPALERLRTRTWTRIKTAL